MKKEIFGISIVLVILLIIGYYVYSMTYKYIDDYTPEEIYNIFQNDEKQALIEFQNKVFLFRNTSVLSYEKSVLKEGKYSVSLYKPQENFFFYATVLCYLDVTELEGVNIGGKVDISGTLINFDYHERVIFENCKIHKVYLHD